VRLASLALVPSGHRPRSPVPLDPTLAEDLAALGLSEGPPDAEGFAALLEMVSERYEELAALREQRAQASKELGELRELARMSVTAEKARAQFIANMSHELRTPMNAIIGYSEMLIEELHDLGHDELTDDVRRVERSGRHLLRLINDILDLSKIDAGKMEVTREKIELEALANEVKEAVTPAALDRANDVVIELADDVDSMISDGMRVRQCLLNLMSNAVKFTQGGLVILRITRRGRWNCFEVEDDGIGMSLNQQKRIFAEFTQGDASTTRRFGGTGLGLTLTRRFTEMLGGTISVKSTPGVGSTFRLELPDLAMSPERGAVLAARTAKMTPGERVVLAVDDDPDVLELVTRILERDGFKVAAALDGQQALELAERLRPCAILLDVVLPGMSGWEVLSRLKAHRTLHDIPVLMLSTVDDRTRGLSLGAHEYLVKPIDRGLLVEQVQRLHRSDVGSDVLVVDDDYATRRLLRRYLQRDGWTVRTAANGLEALERLRSQKPGLILLDLMMPVMDGLEFVQRLRDEGRYDDVPVVVTTAKDLTREDRARLDQSVTKVLSKHAHSMDQILAEVRDLTGSPD